MGKSKPTNPTAARSRRLLEESLLSLLQDRRLDDIAVGEICTQAQLTRPTFYNHFDSKTDIIEVLIDDTFEEFCVHLDALNIDDMEGIIRAFLDFWAERRDLLNILARDGLLPMMSQRFEPCLHRIYETSPFTDKSMSKEELTFHDAFLAAGMAGLVGRWAREGFAATPKELTAYMVELLEVLASGLERDA